MTYPPEIVNIQNELEQKVAILLHNLDFKFLKSRHKVSLNGEEIGEIDLLFTNDKFLYIIEVTEAHYNITSKKNTFFTKWSKQQFLNLVKMELGVHNKKIIKIYFDFTKNNFKEESTAVNTLLDDDDNGIIAYKDDFEYFKNSYSKIGKWAKSDFLDWVKPDQDKEFKEIEAIQYYIQDNPVYCFVENVSVLLKSCYVYRRRRSSVDRGYQRMLDGKRTAGIQQNIENSRGLSFPNSILIKSPKLSEHIYDKSECPKITKIKFQTNYCSSKIIDGQHRLLGFSKLDPQKLEEYYLTVIALPKIDINTEVATFIDINSKQKRMDNNLILYLKSDFPWPNNSRERMEQKCVNVAKKLNQKILENRIYFGTADESRGDKITLVTIKSTLIMNNQILSTEDEMVKKISRIFKDLHEIMPELVETKGFFKQNQGIRFLFRLINLFERNRNSGRISITQKDFLKDVNQVMNLEFLKHIKDFYGTSSGNMAVKELIEKLKEEFEEKYDRIEVDLKKLKSKK